MDPLSHIRIAHLRSMFLVRLKLKLLVHGDDRYGIVRKDRTHICIEGYPRSANTFAYHLFIQANPGERGHIAHHTHSMANLTQALRYQIPVIVLIRNPVDAVLSAYIKNAFNAANLDFFIRYYIAFYGWLKPRKNEVVIADFGLVTSNLNQVIEQANKKYNASFKKVANLDKAQRQVIQYLQSPEYHNGIMPQAKVLDHLNVPSAQKDEKKKQFRPLILKHKEIGIAQALYQEMIS
jgi:hypothetical protein